MTEKKSLNILLSGVSSFSGSHIARALCSRGHRVVATLTRPYMEYGSDALVSERLEYSMVNEWVEEAPLGSESLLSAVRSENFDVFVNHGAWIKNYRSPDFDVMQSLSQNTTGLATLFSTLAERSCRRIVHSGSIFEADEGRVGGPALSRYGLAKKLQWESVRFEAENLGLAYSKIVIANPIGIYENTDRLCPLFLRLWKQGKKPELKDPQLIRDQVPMPWLANGYVAEIERSDEACRVLRPSGFVSTQLEFVKDFAAQVSAHLELATPYDVARLPPEQQALKPSPLTQRQGFIDRCNTDLMPEVLCPEKSEAFWRDYILWLDSVEDYV